MDDGCNGLAFFGIGIILLIIAGWLSDEYETWKRNKPTGAENE